MSEAKRTRLQQEKKTLEETISQHQKRIEVIGAELAKLPAEEKPDKAKK